MSKLNPKIVCYIFLFLVAVTNIVFLFTPFFRLRPAVINLDYISWKPFDMITTSFTKKIVILDETVSIQEEYSYLKYVGWLYILLICGILITIVRKVLSPLPGSFLSDCTFFSIISASLFALFIIFKKDITQSAAAEDLMLIKISSSTIAMMILNLIYFAGAILFLRLYPQKKNLEFD